MLLDDDVEVLPEFVLEWPKLDPWDPLLDEPFKLEVLLDPDDPLYVAASAAIPAGFPPDEELDVDPWDLDVSVRLNTARI